jgi:hypothetical protein
MGLQAGGSVSEFHRRLLNMYMQIEHMPMQHTLPMIFSIAPLRWIYEINLSCRLTELDL